MFNFKTLLTEKRSTILIVTLNRPEARNAINIDMINEFHQLWKYLKKNPERIRCLILTGSGDKAFCAGADLKARYQMNIKTWKAQYALLTKTMLAMIDCPIPIIAAVNGAAYGGGLELTLASDFAYASKTAIFAQSETKLGLIPGAMGTQNLPRTCGLKRAKELCFTGMPFNAEQAYQWGVINKICEPEKLMEEVLATAETICANAPIAIQAAKKAMNISLSSDIKTGYKFEINAYHKVLETHDRKEGIFAFNEKRSPKFTGK